ncbi:hypothetical protein ACFL06_00950 [Patescibacteria group bacterium]
MEEIKKLSKRNWEINKKELRKMPEIKAMERKNKILEGVIV